MAAALLASAAWPAHAADGRIEINQARVQAEGGFPYVIRSRGSYVLTSDLDPGAAGLNAGIRVEADDVFLDLNGFSIRGPHVCSQSGCPVGVGYGIEWQPLLGGNRVTVVDGTIAGFGRDCVRLGPGAHLERLVISSCGENGAFVEEGSILVGNRVSACGQFGLRMIGPVSFSSNALALNGLGGGSGGPFQGGVSGGGNVCDGPCAPPPKRRFYLTTTDFDGATADAPGNCAQGFHFASLFELHDPSALEYDGLLGATLGDSGAGPPTSGGWVRTGASSFTILDEPGINSCAAWSSTAGFGSFAALQVRWTLASQVSSPWVGSLFSCTSTHPIWCVED
jgi:hypothetical protein